MRRSSALRGAMRPSNKSACFNLVEHAHGLPSKCAQYGRHLREDNPSRKSSAFARSSGFMAFRTVLIRPATLPSLRAAALPHSATISAPSGVLAKFSTAVSLAAGQLAPSPP